MDASSAPGTPGLSGDDADGAMAATPTARRQSTRTRKRPASAMTDDAAAAAGAAAAAANIEEAEEDGDGAAKRRRGGRRKGAATAAQEGVDTPGGGQDGGEAGDTTGAAASSGSADPSEPVTVRRPRTQSGKKKSTFSNDLRLMLYGFGDAATTDPDTVDLLEEMTVDYIANTTMKAAAVANRRGKLKTEDIVFVVRKDPTKVARVEELLFMKEELDRARKAFDAKTFESEAEKERANGGGGDVEGDVDEDLLV